jgi:hypothetical protein
MSWLAEVQQGIGRRATVAALAAAGVGLLAFITGLGGGGAPRTFGVLIASWLFFTGAAVGAVAFRAFFSILEAGWARQLCAIGGGLASFLPVAALVLVVLMVGASAAPWIAAPTGWLAPGTLVVREVLLNALLFGVAWFGVRRGLDTGGRPTQRAAVVYLLLFAVVLSVWAFDYVLGPDPVFVSTMIGVTVFMSAFTAGTSAVILVALLSDALTPQQRRDAGALALALAIFWAYLFCSQFLTIWYGNLPDETEFALRRAMDGWLGVSLSVLALVFAVPFLGLLFLPGGRQVPRLLGGVLTLQLIGLWLSFHVMVVPSLSAGGASPVGVRDLFIAVGMLGAFTLCVVAPVKRGLAAQAS